MSIAEFLIFWNCNRGAPMLILQLFENFGLSVVLKWIEFDNLRVWYGSSAANWMVLQVHVDVIVYFSI